MKRGRTWYHEGRVLLGPRGMPTRVGGTTLRARTRVQVSPSTGASAVTAIVKTAEVSRCALAGDHVLRNHGLGLVLGSNSTLFPLNHPNHPYYPLLKPYLTVVLQVTHPHYSTTQPTTQLRQLLKPYLTILHRSTSGYPGTCPSPYIPTAFPSSPTIRPHPATTLPQHFRSPRI